LHLELPQRNFSRPSGVVDATVCRRSGRIRTQYCNEGAVTLSFLAGTVPGSTCDIHGEFNPYQNLQPGGLDSSFFDSLGPMPELPPDILELIRTPAPREQSGRNQQQNSSVPGNPFSDEDAVQIPRQTGNENSNPSNEAAANEGSDLPSWNPINN